MRAAAAVARPPTSPPILRLLLLRLALVLLCGSSAVRHCDAQRLASSQVPPTEAIVSTETDFLAALGTPSVQVLRVSADISFSADGFIPGSPMSSASSSAEAAGRVYVLTRNVTVTVPDGRDAPTDWYPILDFTAIV